MCACMSTCKNMCACKHVCGVSPSTMQVQGLKFRRLDLARSNFTHGAISPVPMGEVFYFFLFDGPGTVSFCFVLSQAAVSRARISSLPGSVATQFSSWSLAQNMIKTDAQAVHLGGLDGMFPGSQCSCGCWPLAFLKLRLWLFLLGIMPERSLFPVQSIPFSFCFVRTLLKAFSLDCLSS